MAPAMTGRHRALDGHTIRDRPERGMMAAMDGWSFAKGHGTGNDFVILPDPDGDVAP